MVDIAAQEALNQLAQNIQPSNNIFLEFMLSPFFILFLIYVLIFTPFGIIGMISLYNRINNWSKTRDGWIKVRKKLSNYHWIEFWAKPSGRKIKIKGEEGIEFEIPFLIESETKNTDGSITKSAMMGLEKHLDDKKGVF